ncbi:MAG TPA: patatin-like phospholipase family protein, partial [Dehalococcoidia bacterium]|nr:patatin-like phospholipase family protein [Dehalococcoidia bacterium]
MTYKILSLNGGGARGIYQAVYLKNIAGNFPAPFCKSFDLIAGTSTGSIVAAGVAFEIDLDKISKLFEEKAPEIFASRRLASLRSGPRYSSAPLREELRRIFGDRTLVEATTPLLIPATALNRYAPRAFSPFHEPGVAYSDPTLKIVDVVMASCAAPSYFAPVKVEAPVKKDVDPRMYVDGGMWANSPSLDAVIHVYYYLKKPFDEMKLVSLGNG